MSNVSHDISTVRAVIKGAITTWSIAENRHWKSQKDKVDQQKRRRTRKNFFKFLKKYIVHIYDGYVFSTCLVKERFGNNQAFAMVHLDFENSMALSEDDYPKRFFVALKIITTKGNFDAKDVYSSFVRDYPITLLSRHSLERIVQRNACESLNQATEILRPLCSGVLSVFLLFEQDMKSAKQKRRVLVSKYGYAILAWDNTAGLPIVLTWIPFHWWDEKQHAKLDALIEVLKKLESDLNISTFWVVVDKDLFNIAAQLDPNSIPKGNYLNGTWENILTSSEIAKSVGFKFN